ncbi:hypothetical protein TL16_g01307 [Triparma laevis f. inornata]|uniref:Uncharacterized protein n=1 Tax=Triparma laevis f. inornata TaxID=1714386 RepID=A0A9W7DQT2_9STRA|nr:hypothetical protein TL16_g01307 [Triparma laevis f. inornata]
MADDGDFAFSDDEQEEEIDPATLCPELYSAVQKNDLDKCMEFIEMEVPVDYLPEASDENNNKPCTWTMLHWAAFHGNVALTSALLDSGANSDYKEARMSVQLRAQAGRTKSTAPFAVCMNTPLHLAATKGHLRVCWTLLQAKYSVDDVDNVGNTPLHLAAAHKNKAVLNCLIEHASLAHKKNNFQNKAIDLCTEKGCRALLKSAMSKPVLGDAEREEVQQKHLDDLVDYEESIQSVDMDSESVNIEELEEKLRSGIEFGVSAEVAELGENLIKELRLEQKLKKQISDLKENAPIITQTLYCDYVNSLEETVAEVQKLIDPEGEGRGLADMVKTGVALCKTAHAEYWLCVATKSVSGVECATEATVKLMGRLKESIAKAGMNEANEDLISAGTKVHSRLTNEVELLRAKESFPAVKLPPSDPEEMSSKELKEYWLEDNPDEPVDIGKLEETREWPLPPEDTGEYIWIPSVAYGNLKTACDRLEVALSEGEKNEANADLVEEAKKIYDEKMVDARLLEGKNDDDKGVAIAAAEKLAKKLKKKKKK